MVERARHGIDIDRERAQGILHRDHAQALHLQQRDYFAPARRVDPSAVDDHDCRSVEVTRHAPESIRVTSSRIHLALTRAPALVESDSRAALSMSAATAAGC